MKLIVAFLRLIRFTNLLFIAITQCLFYYCILLPVYHEAGSNPLLHERLFWLLLLSSVVIAAAGYIINDYFDLHIDQINKPGKMVVEKVIKRRYAIIWHWVLSFVGIVLGIYVGWKLKLNIGMGIANLICVVCLWFYSTTFKKKLLIGNVIISLLVAWVVLVVVFAESALLWDNTTRPAGLRIDKLLRLTFLYAGFAFIISLIREIVKDMQDMPGDAKYGCKTMPISWGVHVTKVFAATWLIVLLGALTVLEVYVLQFPWWWPALYGLLLIMLPLLLLFKQLFPAKSPSEFHNLSNRIKFVMFTGILSMVFFRLYAFQT
ncbi:MAG TPA: geranylgeranylglycerol-phosphate geranylgeranyltransferase [Flavitalea sp.]|nr:geranylgeranylglycerol-phosphate geranylgeranyltransferase [Flavitalea sp.]